MDALRCHHYDVGDMNIKVQQLQLTQTKQQSNQGQAQSHILSLDASDLPTKLTLRDDEIAVLETAWAADLQMDNIIKTDSQQRLPSCQQLLQDTVDMCHQVIESQLNSQWSTAFNKYARMTKSQKIIDPLAAIPEELIKKRLERMILKSNLIELTLQKCCFDNAIYSYLEEIINICAQSEPQIDIKVSQAIQKVMHKINLEINRLSIKLPIYARRYEIQQFITNNPVVVIKGETGSGKSTQIPQYAAELNIGKVICTQPRKVAAISLANHLTQQYRNINSSVHYIVNHSSLRQESHNDSIITFVTDSILLNMLIDDPTLSSYGCVIVDEVHERSLYTDILLAFLKQALTQRHDLKLIITSATINTELFSHYFNDCPIISVSGKLFPVDIKWCNEHVNNYFEKALDTVVDIHNTGGKGDILVFLVTPDETEKACVQIKKRFSNNPNSIIALPLHGRLQANDQQNIFMNNSSGQRKIIFATNCAETSITIPGIRYVIDTGLVKERVYNNQSNCHALRIHPICQSSAIQRCGRAGRTQSGICYRLYSQQVYDNMPQSSEPEIKRVHLSNIILKMIELGVTDIMKFNFIEPPSSQNMSDALDTLCMVSAITKRTSPLSLTSLGKLMNKLPLEPRLSALIINAKKWNILSEGIIIASALSISCHLYLRYGSEEDKRDSDLVKAQFCCSDGDVISAAEVYLKWLSLNNEEERKNWCFENKINLRLIRQLDSTVYELKKVLQLIGIVNNFLDIKMPLQLDSCMRNKLRQLILQSYQDKLALYTGCSKLGYVMTHSDKSYLIHPSSVLFPLGCYPTFIICQEILTTCDEFLINITPINEQWLQDIDDTHKCVKIKGVTSNLAVTRTIDNLGSSVLSDYDPVRIHQVVKKLLQDENIRCYIRSNIKDGSLDVTAVKSKMPKLMKIMNESIIRKKESLINAIKTVPIEDHKDAPRLIIGRGITVKDILLPGNYVEFKIALRYTGDGSPDEDTVVDAINEARALINSCGNLAVNIDNNGINKSKDCRYIQFMNVVYQEITSQSLVKEIDMKIVSGYEISVENGSVSSYCVPQDRARVQFRWGRRLRNGNCTVYCKDRNAASTLMTHFPVDICCRTIHGWIDNKCPSNIFLRRLRPSTREIDILMAIPLCYRPLITKLHFHRFIDDTMPSIDAYKINLCNLLDNNEYGGKYSQVTIKPILSSKTSLVIADVIFRTNADALSAVNDFNNRVFEQLINEPLSVRLSHCRKIKCRPEVYNCVAKVINHLQNATNKGDDQEKMVHIHIYPGNEKYQMTSITIKSWDETTINEMVHRIGKIIEPVKVAIDDTEIMEYFSTKDGKLFFTLLADRFQVYGKSDWRSHCLLIYGDNKVKEQAVEFCHKTIAFLLSKRNIIKLTGDGKPGHLVKMIIKRYGINLYKLRELSGADIIQLNMKNKTLIVIGHQDSYTSVVNEIELCCSSSDVCKEKLRSQTVAGADCVSCFTEVDDDDYYRLQYCGHLYCRECIRNQINVALTTSKFPLSCACCSEEFVIDDLERLMVQLPRQRLFDILLSEFMRRNASQWRFCPTAGCKSVYKTSQGNQVFTCYLCEKKTCRGCDTDHHPGFDCNAIKLYRENPDASFLDWVKEKSQEVKKCPNHNCNAVIEKVYGCNHMQCILCHIHFCWICLAGFKSSDKCYEHLQTSHGSYI